MLKKCNIFENSKYKFLNYSAILKDIRNLLLEDLSPFDIEPPIKVNSHFIKTCIATATLEEILKAYVYMDITKVNAIIIPNNVDIVSHGVFSNDLLFLSNSVIVLNQCKRKIPLLIKNIDCSFCSIDEYLETGEGIEFLLQLECDRDKLRNAICSFREFKQFAEEKKLKYIVDNLIDKIEFKRLFIS